MSHPAAISDAAEDMPLFRAEAGDAEGWRKRDETRLFDHRYIQVDEITYETPHRPDPVRWTVARRKNAVVVAPRLADGRFLLIRQERYPVEQVLWEFPAGQIDEVDRRDDPEVILATARRELEEETHYAIASEGSLRPLGFFFSSQGFTDEHAYLFLAEPVDPLPVAPAVVDQENILGCQPFTPEEIRALIAGNVIVDANTLAVFARLCALGILG